MSKLYINDLERIKNGQLVKFNFGYKTNKDEINLEKVDNQIKDLRFIRYYILNLFKEDSIKALNNTNGVIENNRIDFNPRELFLSKYLYLTISTVLGDTNCLISKKGLESASFESEELITKIKKIEPFIKGILKLNEKTNILENIFYEEKNIFNENLEKNLIINGDGILLPFKEYINLELKEKNELLSYYYSNIKAILCNILVPDDDVLNIYRTNVSKQKALAIYKNID